MLLRTPGGSTIQREELFRQIKLISVQTTKNCKAPLICVSCILYTKSPELKCIISLDERKRLLQDIFQMYHITEADLFEEFL